MSQSVNLVLALIVIGQICFGLVAWLSPQFLRRLAARLMARAESAETYRKSMVENDRHWRRTLGVEEKRPLQMKTPESTKGLIA